MNTIDLEGKKVFIQPDKAELANKENVVIGESREKKDGGKSSGRKVTIGKQPGGGEIIKITIRNSASTSMAQQSRTESSVTRSGGGPELHTTLLGSPESQVTRPRSFQPLGGQSKEHARTKFIKPKNPEVGKWNENRVQRQKIKPTFDMLLAKYADKAAGFSSSRPLNSKCSRSPHKQKYQRNARPYGALALIRPKCITILYCNLTLLIYSTLKYCSYVVLACFTQFATFRCRNSRCRIQR